MTLVFAPLAVCEAQDEEGHSAAAPTAADNHGAAEHAGDDPGHEEAGHGEHAAEGGAHANTNPLSIDPDLAIFTAIVFVLLFLFLSKFAWKPIAEGLDRRESSIAAMIDEARQNQEKTAQQLKQYEARLAAAAQEARDIVAQAHKDAEATAARLTAEAQENANRMANRAKAEIEAAKNGALAELAERSVQTAVDLAGRLVRREIRPDDHAQLVQDALAKFPSKN